MSSLKLHLFGFVAFGISGVSIVAADTPSISDVMAYKPSQKDVDYEIVKPAEYAKCKIEVERRGKISGWVVLGPSGQTLRKFLDVDGVGGLDQYRYYNHGIEVYREIDTNNNAKMDEYRWLNLGGSRWGIDKNEDGKIDAWKVLTAAEASKEAIRAMTTGDETALRAIMINSDDLDLLRINPQIKTRILESASDPWKKAKTILSKSKTLTPQSVWTRFDAQPPGTVPADDEKAVSDLQVYESAMAIIETPTKDKQQSPFHAVQIGEMIRVGEVWKLTQVPSPIEGPETITSSGILMEPLSATATTAAAANANPKVEKILKDLSDIDAQLVPGTPPAKAKSLMAKREELLTEAIDLAETEDSKMPLMKQRVDGYALAAQVGIYPDGVQALKSIEADWNKKMPKSALVPYVVYRLLHAEYAVDSQKLELQKGADDKDDKDEKDKKKFADVQKKWLDGLKEFVKKYSTADDADDAMLTLANQEELQGDTPEAIQWYERIVKDRAKSESAQSAQGALRRIHLNDKELALAGPSLDTTKGTVDVKKLRGKAVLVVFWASEWGACEEIIPQLRALYQDNNAKGFEIVGVCLDTDNAAPAAYVQKNKMTWPEIFEPGENGQSAGGFRSSVATSFGIISVPTMFLVDKEGKVKNRNASISDVKNELPNLLNPANVAQKKNDPKKNDPK